MTKDESLKLALEALEADELDMVDDGSGNMVFRKEQAIIAIKEAWAQPERDYERGFIDGMQKQMQSSVDKAVNAMTQPTYYIPNKDERTWVGLTDDEIYKIAFTLEGEHWKKIADAIEAKLKDKNT